MSMKKLRLGGLFLLMIAGLLLMSCEEMFTTNIFQDLDKLDLSNMSSEEKAVAVLDNAEGAIEDLSDTEVDELIQELEDLYTDPSEDPDTRKQAAAAAAAVELADSGADDTLNNLSRVVQEIDPDDPTAMDDPGDILNSIFSDDNGDPLSVAEIEAQLSSMLEAAAALAAYGSVLGDGGEAPAGVNPEEVALTAVVVGLVNYININDGQADDAASITAMATAISNNDAGSLNLPPMDDMSNDLDGVYGADLANVIEASGLYTTMMDMMG